MADKLEKAEIQWYRKKAPREEQEKWHEVDGQAGDEGSRGRESQVCVKIINRQIA